MFYNLILIQRYNKSLCNWSCSFTDMSMLGLFPYILLMMLSFFPKKENKKLGGRNCQSCNPVLLPIHSHNREKERRKGRKRKTKKKAIQLSCSEGWSVMERGISSWRGPEKRKWSFALSGTLTPTPPDPPWPSPRLTSIAACSESDRIRRRRPNRPWLKEAERRPSDPRRRSESSLTSAGSPGENTEGGQEEHQTKPAPVQLCPDSATCLIQTQTSCPHFIVFQLSKFFFLTRIYANHL